MLPEERDTPEDRLGLELRVGTERTLGAGAVLRILLEPVVRERIVGEVVLLTPELRLVAL